MIEFSYELTDETIKPQNRSRGHSRYDAMFKEFIESDKPSCIITANTSNLNGMIQSLREHIKKHKYNIMVGRHGHGQIYLVKHR